MSNKVPENWDVKVVDYWDAILKSYNNCHEAPETYDTAEKVADSIMEQFPLTALPVEQKEQGTPCKRQKLDTGIQTSKTQLANDEQAAIKDNSDTKDKSYKQENAVDSLLDNDEDNVEEENFVLYKEELEQEQSTEYLEKGPTENEDTEKYDEEEENEEQEYAGQAANQDYADQQGEIPQQEFSYPPPPPSMEGQDDGLSNVIMAWYYAGYYTALYQRSQNRR